MIKLYYNPRPNPRKVALFLEEAGLAYEIEPVDVLKGEHLTPAFHSLNPNAKVPVIDDDGTIVFDSTAILLYLSGKTGLFGAADDPACEGPFLSWLLFIATGLAPFSGQAVHFAHYAPVSEVYSRTRYGFESERHWGLVEQQLARGPYVLGDRFTAVDIALWGWAPDLAYMLGEDAWSRYPNVARWLETVSARPAVGRVAELESRFVFKAEIDEDALRHMFPHATRVNDQAI